MAIKHLTGYSKEEIRDKINPKVPIWKRKEAWRSPLAFIFIIGYVIYGIGYAIFWLLRFILFSWMRPLTKSTWLCKIGLHRWRFLRSNIDYTFWYCESCFQGVDSEEELVSYLSQQSEADRKRNYFSLWQ